MHISGQVNWLVLNLLSFVDHLIDTATCIKEASLMIYSHSKLVEDIHALEVGVQCKINNHNGMRNDESTIQVEK